MDNLVNTVFCLFLIVLMTCTSIFAVVWTIGLLRSLP